MTETVIIGKTVIETLTSGMYENALFVYREYIQNAADQIDKAVEMGFFDSRRDGKIYITVSPAEKKIVIEDNATGIDAELVFPMLSHIANSTKDRSKDKGFRGIGRLGGLGYCEKLIFETSSSGESVKSILSWDAKALHRRLTDTQCHLSASELVTSVIQHKTYEEDPNKRYFKVILEGVSNPLLLNKEIVESYLTMVAPVPFNSDFIFKNKIKEELKKHSFELDEYDVFLNTNQVYKDYSATLYDVNGQKYDEIYDIHSFTLSKTDGSLLAVGWYGESGFEKQIPGKKNPARGIRLRKGNIQIGAENALEKFFSERRGIFYYIGELHAISPNLVPNARRDYFNENETCFAFENSMLSFCENSLNKIYRTANQINNAVKKLHKDAELHQQIEKKNKEGFSSEKEKDLLLEKAKQSQEERQKAQKELERLGNSNNPTIQKILHRKTEKAPIPGDKNALDSLKKKTFYRTDKLSSLNRSERRLVSDIFEVIDTNLDERAAEELKLKIEQKLSQNGKKKNPTP